MTRPIWLAAVGDANDPATFGGTPFHVLQAGQRNGTIAGGLRLDLNDRQHQVRRLVWNLTEFFLSRHWGGYQYTDTFQARLWRNFGKKCQEIAIVNFFQLYPNFLFKNNKIKKWFYIDQTLTQLYEYYRIRNIISPRIAKEAMQREREQYQMASGIICDTEWAAHSVLDDYQLRADRVHVVVGGGNLDAESVERWDRRLPAISRSGDAGLRLAFVGKDWRRKGLDRLLRAIRSAQRRGARISIVVIGPTAEAMPPWCLDVPGVDWVGFVNKEKEAVRFVELLGACDVGVLLSHAEAGGRSLREFARLGLPTIAPDVGGSPEFVTDGATHLVPPDAPDEVIADILYRLATDRALLAEQKRIAWAARHTASWDHAVRRIAEIIHAHG